MKVKICGIRNIKDALFSIESGADALGFVFYKKSPRYISPEHAQKIINKLPPFICNVGLFVNESANEINKILKYSKINTAQIHFNIEKIELEKIKYRTLPVVRAKNIEDIKKNYIDEFRLIDSYSKSYGGVGKKLSLELFDNIDCSKIILAGGLSIHNIYEVKKYNFYGVDVSSGVEGNIKGEKDLIKILKFIKIAKEI